MLVDTKLVDLLEASKQFLMLYLSFYPSLMMLSVVISMGGSIAPLAELFCCPTVYITEQWDARRVG